jgi:biopolymer transport protein TolR
MAQHGSGQRKLMAEINVVPFIDVMLVLLVIFMLTTPLLTQGVKVDLPKTAAKALPPQQKEPLIVSVDASGNYYLNTADKPTQAITARTLVYLTQMQLKTVRDDAQQRPVLVRGDKNVAYGKILEAMLILQGAGAKTVGLVTEAITAKG